jgi:uncharacterized protein YacL
MTWYSRLVTWWSTMADSTMRMLIITMMLPLGGVILALFAALMTYGINCSMIESMNFLLVAIGVCICVSVFLLRLEISCRNSKLYHISRAIIAAGKRRERAEAARAALVTLREEAKAELDAREKELKKFLKPAEPLELVES